MSTEPQYNIRDKSGNVYGPADAATLAQWTQQGRIVAGMGIAPDGTDNWVEASTHPAIAHLFGNVPAGGPVGNTGVLSGDVVGGGTALPNPYAGQTAQYQTPAEYSTLPPKLNILALLSMIAGILSIPLFCCICGSGPLAVGAVVMGVIGIVQCSKSPERYTGKALAWVGVCTGGLGLLVSAAYLIIVVVMENKP